MSLDKEENSGWNKKKYLYLDKFIAFKENQIQYNTQFSTDIKKLKSLKKWVIVALTLAGLAIIIAVIK